MNSRSSIILPIAFAIVLSAGIYIGARVLTPGALGSIPVGRSADSKIDQLLRYIEKKYVDTLNEHQLVDKTLTALLQTLDPHSSYIPAEELENVNEQLHGEFDGIGVEFNIINDTIRVIAAISGGPSEAIGVTAGDKIVSVDGKSVAGVKIKNKDVFTHLRGRAGTKVKVGIIRSGNHQPIYFTITRGKIPIHSVDVAYMVQPGTGYIKINRFSEKTVEEYLQAAEKLQKEGMQRLILDLRDNPGGFLQAAVELSDEFLEKGKMIVYTEGRAHPREQFKSTSKGGFEKNKLVVLIDEGSASASEIVAGAVQDNDRGIIVGRRSFGKGLVQSQTALSDGSAIRLTVARYYTPTGRCIQKPYSENVDEYYKEEEDRYKKGELYHADSIHFKDSLQYKTPGGKIVYGGGGIMPDVFIPLDTSDRSSYFSELVYSGTLNQFAFNYADKHRGQLKGYETMERFQREFSISEQDMAALSAFAEKAGIKKDAKANNGSQRRIKLQLKAIIARNIWGVAGFYYVINTEDPALIAALKELAK